MIQRERCVEKAGAFADVCSDWEKIVVQWNEITENKSEIDCIYFAISDFLRELIAIACVVIAVDLDIIDIWLFVNVNEIGLIIIANFGIQVNNEIIPNYSP